MFKKGGYCNSRKAAASRELQPFEDNPLFYLSSFLFPFVKRPPLGGLFR
jgi:hypothetical protein